MRTVIEKRVEDGVETYRETTHEIPVALRRYLGPWSGYMQISFEGMMELHERLADRTLGMQAVRVLLAMLQRMEKDNRCRAGVKDLARILEMNQSDVSKALKKLVECGFVEPPELRFDPYTVSPRFAWKASVDKLRMALKVRHMLGDDGMMRAKTAA